MSRPSRLRLIVISAVAVLVAVPALTISSLAFWHTYGPGRFPVAQNFTLVDQSGHDFALSEDRGKPIVLFFGYTHCPDVCPTTLAALAHAKRSLGEAGRQVAVVFVTVDAPRDTPAVLKKYVALFDPTFIGLSGSEKALTPVYSAYHVFHEDLPAKDSAAGYLVAHSTAIYFIGRDGRIHTIGDWSDTPDVLKADLEQIIG